MLADIPIFMPDYKNFIKTAYVFAAGGFGASASSAT